MRNMIFFQKRRRRRGKLVEEIKLSHLFLVCPSLIPAGTKAPKAVF